MKLHRLALFVCLAALTLPTANARAFSAGIATTSFPGAAACNSIGCHSGGSTPTVAVSGPASVAAGSTNEYTLTITTIGSQMHGGFNVSSLLGALMMGGAESALTKEVVGAGALTEITHTARKADVAGEIKFSFLWTAPVIAGPASLEVWGNAVNFDFTSLGDAASLASVAVSVAAPVGVPGLSSPWAQGALILLLLALGSSFVWRRRESLF